MGQTEIAPLSELVDLNMRYDPEETERRASLTLAEIAVEIAEPLTRLTPEQVEAEWPELSDADVEEVVLLSRSIRLEL